MPNVELYCGDCLEVMAGMDANSIDTIITDPPYGLSFMGKDWDHGVPGIPFWKEMLRVAKPGAFLLAFGGTRTSHRLTCAIEDAGWLIRDCLMWVCGEGFCKSHNISKAIDKAAGAEREVVGKHPVPGSMRHRMAMGNGWQESPNITAPATEAAKLWDGWGTGIKPSYEPIIVAMKEVDSTFANNALVHGVAGLNINGCRIGTETVTTHGGGGQCGSVLGWSGKDGRKEPTERTSLNTQHSGRWPANLLISHHSMCRHIGTRKVKGDKRGAGLGIIQHQPPGQHGIYGTFSGTDEATPAYGDSNGLETIDSYLCAAACPCGHIWLTEQLTPCPDCGCRKTVWACPVRGLDEQSGITQGSSRPRTNKGKGNVCYGEYETIITQSNAWGDKGGASRYFKTFSGERMYYCAKAPRKQRWAYCSVCDAAFPSAEREEHEHGKEKQTHIVGHPTQKPEALIRYLVRLTRTPTGGMVLDPFMGSGTTGIACVKEDRDFVGIDITPDYVEIAQACIDAAQRECQQLSLPNLEFAL